jgi:hypothetical protein
MGLKGAREFPLTLTANAVLERNRIVSINVGAGTCVYSSYGSVAGGVVTARSDANTLLTTVAPLNPPCGTFAVDLVGTCAAEDALVPVVNGKVSAKTYTVIDDMQVDNPTVVTNGDIYLIPADGWTTASGKAGQIATYNSGWTYAAPAVGAVLFNSKKGIYMVATSTSAWAECKVVGYATEAGVDGQTIIAGPALPQITRDQIPSNLRSTYRLHDAGVFTGVTGATQTIGHPDVAATDIVFAQIQASTNAVSVQKVTPTANTITVLCSGNCGASTIVQYAIYKPVTN